MTIHIQDIALSKLVPSPANVRRTARAERIDELAASIAAHGLLQNLTVRAADKDRFEVIAGGRRLAALKLLAKRKQWAKNAPVPCQVMEGDNVAEISLAENALQCPMHPADQFEAFAELHQQQMGIEDIAARFGVTPTIVVQRLKLGAVSKALMAVYRDGEMSLEQLSAFAITDDHDLQERVWRDLGYDRSRQAILRALNDEKVAADDRRAVFVGVDAYRAAGGTILRDLFDEEGGGFFNDAALLNRLVNDRLALEAEKIAAEGWKWVAVEIEFDYGLVAGMRRLYPSPRPLSQDEDDAIHELSARYEALCDEDGDEPPEAIAQQMDDIDREIDAIRGDDVYAPGDMAMAGAFISLSRDGKPRIERGFVRREDEATPGRDMGDAENGHPVVARKDALPAQLVAELTAYRTAALANELAQRPDLALVAVTHVLAAHIFYTRGERASCLGIDAHRVRLKGHAKDIDDTPAAQAIDRRHAGWEELMPDEPAGLWTFVLGLPEADRQELLAHCVSLTVDAVCIPQNLGSAGVQEHADTMASALALDMTAYWQPTASGFFGRVTKDRVLRAVREGHSPEAAQSIERLKKPAMAERAEKLLTGKGWLPEPLRNPVG